MESKKNCEKDKINKTNNSSSSKQLKVWYSISDLLTTDKLNELKRQINCDYPNVLLKFKQKKLSELYLCLNAILMAII